MRGGGFDFQKNPGIHFNEKGSSGELKNQEHSVLVRESFLTKAISCHPKGRLVRRMISASRKRILFESFEHSFFSCFDLKPLPNLEIKIYPDFKRKIPLKELDI